MKECKRCHRQLPETEFYKNIRAKDGLQSWCKSCINDYDKNVRPFKEKNKNGGAVIGNSHEKVPHPTQKPVALIEYLIKTYTNEGDTVLDNCMGSGTTAIACINTGRNYIGFETDGKFFCMAQERIARHKQLKLF